MESMTVHAQGIFEKAGKPICGTRIGRNGFVRFATPRDSPSCMKCRRIIKSGREYQGCQETLAEVTP